jgi:hypothetical protein
MSRIRLNQEIRNKIASRWRVHIENEDTQERETFMEKREGFKPLQDKTWKLAEKCVRRHYPIEDVNTCYDLQRKYPNVDTVNTDSCFHFGYMQKKDGDVNDEDLTRDQNGEDDKYVSKHFDFRLNGEIDGTDRQTNQSRDENGEPTNNWGRPSHRGFAYAYFRDELKASEGCNPDIDIEMSDKQSNPHQTKFQDANDRKLGFISGNRDLISYSKEWDNDYKLDLIGREYCRDRQIEVNKDEFAIFMFWQQAKGQLQMAHYKWIDSVLKQMKFVKGVLKGYKYLDEALEFAKESDLTIDEAEILRCNSSGLMIYNPKNAAQMLKSMKNKNQTREQKILARQAYERREAQK